MRRNPFAFLDQLKFTEWERAEIMWWFHKHDPLAAKAPEAPTAEQVPLPIGDLEAGPSRKQRQREREEEYKARLRSAEAPSS